jgi:hypothetical protein
MMNKAVANPLTSFILMCGLFLSLLPAANASLIGQSVDFCFNGTRLGPVTTDTSECTSEGSAVVVDPGVEFVQAGSVGAIARDVDLTADTISLIYSGVSSGSPDLFILSNLNWGSTPGSITGLTLLTADPLSVITMFTADTIGLLVTNPLVDATVTFRIETTHVPIPSMLPLFVLGLVVMFARCKRRVTG